MPGAGDRDTLVPAWEPCGELVEAGGWCGQPWRSPSSLGSLVAVLGVIAVMQEEMDCKEFPAAQGMLLPCIKASWPQSYCQQWPQRAQNMLQNPQVFSSREMLGCAMNPCVRAHSWLGGDPGLALLLKAPVFLVVFCFF